MPQPHLAADLDPFPARPVTAQRPLLGLTVLLVEDSRLAYGFLTCAPNPLVARVHPNAMPVILHTEDHHRWLDGTIDDVRELASPFPSQLMNIRTGAVDVNESREEGSGVVVELPTRAPY